jgi:hypothetical protein
LNPIHIFPKKEKEPKTKRLRKAVLMSQFDDDDDERNFVEKSEET